MIAATLGK